MRFGDLLLSQPEDLDKYRERVAGLPRCLLGPQREIIRSLEDHFKTVTILLMRLKQLLPTPDLALLMTPNCGAAQRLVPGKVSYSQTNNKVTNNIRGRQRYVPQRSSSINGAL
jgi:hypothetical protein